jgi:Tat protein secretion system quality control protein TatD with DNase activity
MIHSFTGSTEISLQLLKLKHIGSRFYFSFSPLNLQSPKVFEKIKQIPDDRILLESDQNSVLLVDEAIDKMIDLVSQAKNWNRNYTIERTIQNTLSFLKDCKYIL